MDPLTAAGKRGKGAGRGKRTLGTRIENFAEFITALEMEVFVFGRVSGILLKWTSRPSICFGSSSLALKMCIN